MSFWTRTFSPHTVPPWSTDVPYAKLLCCESGSRAALRGQTVAILALICGGVDAQLMARPARENR